MKFKVQYWDNVHHTLKTHEGLTIQEAQHIETDVLLRGVTSCVTITRTSELPGH